MSSRKHDPSRARTRALIGCPLTHVHRHHHRGVYASIPGTTVCGYRSDETMNTRRREVKRRRPSRTVALYDLVAAAMRRAAVVPRAQCDRRLVTARKNNVVKKKCKQLRGKQSAPVCDTVRACVEHVVPVDWPRSTASGPPAS
ncbi:hypothetical protein MRX96_013084 [Rhipicephalus microplus]